MDGRANEAGGERGPHIDQPSGSAVLRVRLALPIFNTAIDVQDRLIVPCSVSRLIREVVPIVLVATHPIHHVDAGPAAQHLAHGHRKSAPMQLWIWLRLKSPVSL